MVVNQVKYGSKAVEFGNELTPTETQKIPEIHYKHEGGVLYTLVMTGKPKLPATSFAVHDLTLPYLDLSSFSRITFTVELNLFSPRAAIFVAGRGRSLLRIIADASIYQVSFQIPTRRLGKDTIESSGTGWSETYQRRTSPRGKSSPSMLDRHRQREPGNIGMSSWSTNRTKAPSRSTREG